MLTPCLTPLFIIALPPLYVCVAHRHVTFWRRYRLTWLTLSLWMIALLPVCQVLIVAMFGGMPVSKTDIVELKHVPYDVEISRAATLHGLDPVMVAAMVSVESNFQATVVSNAGAMGLMQIMPATAAELGLASPFEPFANLEAGSRYLALLIDYFQGNEELAIMAYHGGPGRIASGGARDIDAQYLAAVQTAMRRYELLALVPDEARITSLPSEPQPWKGIDYTEGCGSAIFAPTVGVVTDVGHDGYIGEYGNNNSYVIISEGERDIIMLHGHYTVLAGQTLRQGDLIGYEASLGNSTGCHTDISIRR